jgi:hypothetical protein
MGYFSNFYKNHLISKELSSIFTGVKEKGRQENKIYSIRGQRIMFDFGLAQLYEVKTKALKQAVKRNIARFPEDFMFELTKSEWKELVTKFKTENSR